MLVAKGNTTVQYNTVHKQLSNKQVLYRCYINQWYCVGCTTSFMSLLKHETICDDVKTKKVSSHHMDLRSKGY